MVRTRRHKLVLRYPHGPSELYDLARDPRETERFIADPAYQAIAAHLTERIDEYFATYEEPDRSGLRVLDLPRHNLDETRRNTGEHRITAAPVYIAEAQAAIDRALEAADSSTTPP